MNKRITQLDSLRGLAALTVVMHHFFISTNVFNGSTYYDTYLIVKCLKYTPLSIIYAGHEAVILFFILSGFVLSLPYLNDKKQSYSTFLIKRLCRLYIPCIISVLLAILAKECFYRGHFTTLNSWTNSMWTCKFSLSNIINHILLLKDFDVAHGYNPILWSLIIEIRISLIFPLLVIVTKKVKPVIIGIICFIFIVLSIELQKYFNMDSLSNYFATFYYIPMFIIGILLAKYKGLLINYCKKITGVFKYMVFIIGLCFYIYPNILPDLKLLHKCVFNDYFTGFGSCIFIIVSLSWIKISNLLSKKSMVYLGKISFSLYLFHFIVQMTLLNILYNYLPIWFIYILSFIFSILIASLSYMFIEKPSIALGKYLSKKFTPFINKSNLAHKC